MSLKTTEEVKRLKPKKVIKEILNEEQLLFSIDNVTFNEDFISGTTSVYCKFKEAIKEQSTTHNLECRGVGVIDAVYNCMINKYQEEYPSLKNIVFENFKVKPDFTGADKSGSDANIEVEISFSNCSKRSVSFRSSKPSIVSAAVQAIFNAVEFYINSELSFKKLQLLLKDAESRHRGDLASRYKYLLSTMVSVTSYECIE
jgi:hypothetical protein